MASLQLLDLPGADPARPNLVFVHGLGGDPRTTWMHDPTDPATLWPAWVGEDSGCRVWLLGYEAAISGWRQAAMALPQQGTSVVDRLLSEPRLRGVPLVMIGHSLGGLVIKQALANATNQGVERYRAFADQVKGVVFVATPNLGSDLASLARALGVLLRTNAQVDDLAFDNAWLANLNLQFRTLHRQLGFRVRIFAETRGVTTARRWWFVRGPSVRVVKDASSDPGVPGEAPIPLEEDHFSICKPADRSAQIHPALLEFLREVCVGLDTDRAAAQIPPDPRAEPSEIVPADADAAAAAADTDASAVAPADLPPTRTRLAISSFGYDDPAAPMLATACVVVDAGDPTVGPQVDADSTLPATFDAWRAGLTRDPLLAPAARQRAARDRIDQLVDDPLIGPRLLDWLATASFSAYVYFGRRAELATLSEDERRRRFEVQPLVHRLSKKSERIERAWTDLPAPDGTFAAAARIVRQKFGRTVPEIAIEPPSSRSAGATLLGLARLVAAATARHLDAPGDEHAAFVFDQLRTRVRFAMNVADGSTHTRDRDPLP